MIQVNTIPQEDKDLYLHKINDMLALEERRDGARRDLVQYQHDTDEKIREMKEEIREFEAQMNEIWTEIKTGQLSLNLVSEGV